MNELQISLLAIGLLIVAGVYGFNRFQERKYRRLAEQAFPSGQEDVLLREGEQDTLPDAPEAAMFHEESRIEPVVSTTEEPTEPGETDGEAEPVLVAEPEEVVNMPAVTHHEGCPAVPLDDAINYVVQLRPGEPVDVVAIIEAIRRQGGFGERARWLGMNPLTGGWEEIGQGGVTEYHRLAATLQLADRSGPVPELDMAAFCSRVQTVADELVAAAEFPDRQSALVRAAALDQFCADVDVLIGLNVITQDGVAFAATKVHALAESAGMKLQPDGAFHFFSGEGADLFSLANLDPAPFSASAENIRQLSTHGITFLFDVPRVADGVRVFNQMLLVARQMASSLGGQVVDDNRRPLSDAGIVRIRQQLADIYARMEAQQIKSGSSGALRLFS